MTSTLPFILALASFAAAVLGLQVLALKYGLRWAKIANPSLLRTLGLYLFLCAADFAAALLIGISLALLMRDGMADPPSNWVTALILFGWYLAVPGCVIAWLYKAPIVRSLQSLVLPSAASFAMAFAAAFIIRPYLYEAFYIPTNAMAPTIVGEHAQSICPQCSAPAYTGVPRPDEYIPPTGLSMICENGHTFGVNGRLVRAGGGDRILVNKLLKPRRWDIIVFRFPNDPTQNYVKRLVGLPGESLFIKDGAVWINGERLEPPPEWKHLQYLSNIPNVTPQPLTWADESRPAVLGPEEYFVVGDFSAASYDSRLWERVAPGHPPYAVPESHIIGVVTHIYWPVSRWRTFR